VPVAQLPGSERGEGGHGSTGGHASADGFATTPAGGGI
jgi:hypothetical protein